MTRITCNKKVLSLCFFCFLISGVFSAFAQSRNEIYRNYLFGEYQDIIDAAKNSTRADDETLYFLGLSYMKMSQFQDAREAFDRLISRYPSSKFREKAEVKKADAYFLDGDYSRARSNYEAIMRCQPKSPFLPLFYLRFAQIAAKDGRWDDKRKYIAIIKSKFSASPEYKYALLLESYDDFFTIQVGAFGNKKNALEVERELRAKYPSYLVQDKKEGTILYKVKIGKFSTRSEAEKMSLKLLEDGFPAVIYP